MCVCERERESETESETLRGKPHQPCLLYFMLRLETLDSQDSLIGKLKDASEGIGQCRKRLQQLGTAPVAADVQTVLLSVPCR